MMLLIILLTLLLLPPRSHLTLIPAPCPLGSGMCDVKVLQPGKPVRHPSSGGGAQLGVYCYGGRGRHLRDALITTSLELKMDEVGGGGEVDLDVFRGTNLTQVYEEFERRHSWFWWSLMNEAGSKMSWLTSSATTMLLPPHTRTCVGVYTSRGYQVKLHHRQVDTRRLVALIIAATTFLLAPHLARSFIFYYTAGLTLGLIASLLLLIFILSRLIPSRSLAWPLLLAGWSLAAYALQLAWSHSSHLISQYKPHLIIYISLSLLLSFAYLYYRGPPTRPRTINLLAWTIRLLTSLTIYLTLQLEEATVLTLLTLLTLPHLSSSCLWLLLPRLPRKPKPRKLITEAEFEAEGSAETERALAELRSHLQHSPSPHVWRVVRRLREPGSFAGWVEGERDHVGVDEEAEWFERDGRVDAVRDDDDVID